MDVIASLFRIKSLHILASKIKFCDTKLRKGDCTSTVTSSGEFEFDKTWEECNLSPTMDGNDIKERFLIPDHKLRPIIINRHYYS